MSTRANIVVYDAEGVLWFYRHSDGYPSVTAESLKTFLRWLLTGKIRDNVSQAAGWLIILGHTEYRVADSPEDWKVGAYEPTTGIHGDIEYLYVIDLVKKEIRCHVPPYDEAKHCATFPKLQDEPEPFHVITAKNLREAVKDPG